MTDLVSPTPNKTQAEGRDDPLLTTEQAAQHMGKTYRQFTAYRSHHQLPSETTPPDPPLYRLSLIQQHTDAARSRQRPKPSAAPLSVAPERETSPGGDQSAQRQTSASPSAEMIAAHRQAVGQLVALTAKNEECMSASISPRQSTGQKSRRCGQSLSRGSRPSGADLRQNGRGVRKQSVSRVCPGGADFGRDIDRLRQRVIY